MYKFNQETLIWETDKKKVFELKTFKKLTIFLIIGLIFFMFYFNSYAQKTKDVIQHQENEIKCLKSNLDSLSQTKDLPLTLKTVDWLIDQLPFKNKELVKKQYRVESGNLKSRLVFSNWNLFGMKNAGNRPQPGCKSKVNDYRHYDHFIFSIFDRCLYDLKHGTSLKGYAEDPNYLQKVK